MEVITYCYNGCVVRVICVFIDRQTQQGTQKKKRSIKSNPIFFITTTIILDQLEISKKKRQKAMRSSRYRYRIFIVINISHSYGSL